MSGKAGIATMGAIWRTARARHAAAVTKGQGLWRLSDRELADIGLSRADVDCIARGRCS